MISGAAARKRGARGIEKAGPAACSSLARCAW
jgi:hypothetical protein